MIKRLLVIILSVVVLLLFGCRERDVPKAASEEVREIKGTVWIICENSVEAISATQYISAAFLKNGYESVVREYYDDIPPVKNVDGVVFVGDCYATGYDVPTVRCFLDNQKDAVGENVICPRLLSGSIARAGVLLLPAARSFCVISDRSGAMDVQDACDVLDMSGVDYRVEVPDRGEVWTVMETSVKDGCDVILIPYVDPVGATLDMSSYGAAVIGIGDSEPVKGALASFCVDTERLCSDAAELCVCIMEEREFEGFGDSYYTLCVSEREAKRLSADIQGVSEDFFVEEGGGERTRSSTKLFHI